MTQHKNAFLHQFSSDEQDLLQVYLGLFLMYCILTPIQLHATQKQKHPISKLLAIGLCVQFLALALICLHYGLFAANGQGIRILSVIGMFSHKMSVTTFFCHNKGGDLRF